MKVAKSFAGTALRLPVSPHTKTVGRSRPARAQASADGKIRVGINGGLLGPKSDSEIYVELSIDRRQSCLCGIIHCCVTLMEVSVMGVYAERHCVHTTLLSHCTIGGLFQCSFTNACNVRDL